MIKQLKSSRGALLLGLGITLAFLSESLQAHEVQLITQHLNLQRQNQVGWQSDLLARATLSRKWDVGLQGTYLERFGFYERRAGAFLFYHVNDRLTLEGRYLQGNLNEILPRDQENFNAYYALSPGFSAYMLYKHSRYSVTQLHTVNLGLEIEKWANWLIIPQVMGGKATFQSPSQTKDLHNYGIKVTYYREALHSLFAFGYKGKEAAQGIVGRSNQTVDTLSGGIGGSYHFIRDLKTEFILDYTDYDQLKNQFLTSTLNLVWSFE